MTINQDTIAAICTPPGKGAIAIIRLSGPNAIHIAAARWKGAELTQAKSHTIHLGDITDAQGHTIDQALISIFRAPHSFTGQDTIEISCHGSTYIQRSILHTLIDAGARPADPGEYSQRAFLNKRIDLAQAEAIADLINAENSSAHQLALSQTKGHYSRHLDDIRTRLIDLASLLELELDFSEEDVTFADRSQITQLATDLRDNILSLTQSYAHGQVLKNGIPTVIAGAPNAGKSTLLNTLASEDMAIVSPIPGTTRDAIQTTINIHGTALRLIDTAGLRQTSDQIEQLGIDRTIQHIQNSSILIWIIDPTHPIPPQTQHIHTTPQHLIIAVNKNDIADTTETIRTLRQDPRLAHSPIIAINATTPQGTTPLIRELTHIIDAIPRADTTVTNARHYHHLQQALQALDQVLHAIDQGLSTDLLALDLRQVIHHLGLITGAITTDDLLQTIFSRFCIGK